MAETQAEVRVLADRLIAGEGILRDVTRIAAANVLLVLCAWIALPLRWTPVPITGQTFGVLLVAVLLGARRSAVVLGLYLLEGLAGLPVFQPFGLPGALRLAGPTAGYLLSYPLAAFATGWIVERLAGSRAGFAHALRLGSALLAGEAVIFLCGCAWLAKMPFGTLGAEATAMGWSRALAAGLVPFVPGELVKMVLVVSVVRSFEFAHGGPRRA